MECAGAKGTDGPLPVTGGFKVKREFERNGGFAACKESFEFLCDADMTAGAAGCGLSLVEDFAIELVREGVKV